MNNKLLLSSSESLQPFQFTLDVIFLSGNTVPLFFVGTCKPTAGCGQFGKTKRFILG